MERKDGLNVNSSMAEFKKAIKKERLTLEEAQEIALLIYDKYNSLNWMVQKDTCRHCKKSNINPKILKRTKDRMKLLWKLSKRFYPYLKYDW